MTWYGLNGDTLDREQAVDLLADLETRTIGYDEVVISSETLVVIRTAFVVWADSDDENVPRTALWESVTYVRGRPERTTQPHFSRAVAELWHARTVDELRTFAASGNAGDGDDADPSEGTAPDVKRFSRSALFEKAGQPSWRYPRS